MKKALLSVVLLFIGVTASAQLSVETAGSLAAIQSFADSLVRHLLVDGTIDVQSVSYNGSPEALGYFNGGASAPGVREGLILSTGKAMDAMPAFASSIGPNTQFGLPGDPDITTLATPFIQQSPTDSKDAAAVTIRFVPSSGNLGVSYIYASRDYGRYQCSDFIDLPGFFLSGPGISGPFSDGAVQVATVPGKPGVPVCINSINDGTGWGNDGSNTSGCTLMDENWLDNTIYYEGGSPEVSYNGFTQLLPSHPVTVIPGQPYTLRIVIADSFDGSFDSAIFLEPNSLSSDFYLSAPSVDSVFIDTTICSGFPFLLPDGSSYGYGPGLNQDTLTLLDGLDTTFVFLNLEVIESADTLLAYTACQEETIEIRGQPYTQDTTFIHPISTGAFCDSLIVYELVFLPAPSSRDTAYVCNSDEVGEAITFHPVGQNCDSVVYTTNVLDPALLSYGAQQVNACPGDTLSLLGWDITQDTVLLEHLPGAAANGCDSITEWRVRFRAPQFHTLADIPSALCLSDSLTIIYGEGFAARYDDYGIEVRSDSLPLPDGTGAAYIGMIEADTFPVNTVIQDAAEVEICVNMEHSWMHDLDISLICPNGSRVVLQRQEFISNEVNLGEPYEADDASNPPVPAPGQGYTYCWTADATAGTWTEFALANDPGGLVEYTLPPGNYNSYEPLDDLVGCSWNGNWALEVLDRWSMDNGWIFYWSIRQRFATVDSLAVASGAWASSPAISTSGDTLNFTAGQTGPYAFTYALSDTLGCLADTTFIVGVLPTFYEERDTVLCRGSMLGDVEVYTAGNYPLHLSSAAGCDSTLMYQVEVIGPDITQLTEITCNRDDAGLFEESYTGSGGCDSLVLVTVVYDPPADTTLLTVYTCNTGQEDELLLLQNAEGCDSLVLVQNQYTPLNYSLAVIPDTCLRGQGSLEIELIDNPDYGVEPDIQLYNGPPSFTLVGAGALYTGLSGGDYLLEISAGPNCQETIPIAIGSIGGAAPSNVDFNASVDALNVSFFAPPPATGAEFFWDFGDGANASGQFVQHQYAYNGLYETCLTAVNGCGEVSDCQLVFLPFRIEPDGATGASGQAVVVPVRTNGAHNLGGLEMAIQFLNPNAIRIDSIEAVALSAGNLLHQIVDDGALLGIGWEAGAPPGLTLEPGEVLFNIHLTLTGQPGDVCEMATLAPPAGRFYFSDFLLNAYPNDFAPTFIEVSDEVFALTGEVQTAPYHRTPLAPLANVEVSFMGSPNLAALTGPDGSYLAFGGFSQSYLIEFSKDNDGLNGLSGLGVLRLLRHLAGVLPFTSPYEYLSADLNCNDTVDIHDVTRLQEVLLGNGAGICESWRFVSSEYVFTDSSNPFQATRSYTTAPLSAPLQVPVFYGVKTGDIVGEGNPGLRPVLFSDSLVLIGNNGAYDTGDTITLDLAANGFDSLQGFQFELQFDAEALAFVDATAVAPIADFSQANFGTSQVAGGFFRALWNSLSLTPATLAEGAPLIQLRFVARQPVEQGLAPLIGLYAANLMPEAYNTVFERIPVLLRFDALTGARAAQAERMQLFQNHPNPYRQSTAIPFYLPRGAIARLLITGPLGQVVEQHSQYYPAGRHFYIFRPGGKLPSGLYNYTLQTQAGQATRRMLLVR